MAEVYGEHEGQTVADEEWLSRAGRLGRVVLSQDDRIRYRAVERNAMAGGLLQNFVVVNASITGEEAAAWIITQKHRIFQRCRKPGPYVEGIYRDGVMKRLWPKP